MSWHYPDIKRVSRQARAVFANKDSAGLFARKMRQKEPIVTRKSGDLIPVVFVPVQAVSSRHVPFNAYSQLSLPLSMTLRIEEPYHEGALSSCLFSGASDYLWRMPLITAANIRGL